MADAKVIFETELDTSGLEKGINRLERDGLTTLDFGMSLDGLTKLGTHMGKVMGAQIALSIVKATADAGIAFDTAMSQVAATMGTSVSNIKPLEELARRTGEGGLYTATEAAEALNYLALAGWESEQILAGFANMVTLAAAGAMDLATASDIVTDVITAMGLEVQDTARLSDELAVANNKANGTVKQYGQAMLELGATGQIAEGGTTELLTAFGLLANNGIKGAKAGRQLRNVITSLAAPTDQAVEQMQALGVTAYDSEGNFRPLVDTFADLSASMSTFTEEQRTQAIREIFNKEDLKSVNALLQTSTAEWLALYGEIINSQGAASKMAETQINNLGGDVKKFNAAIDSLKLEAFNVYEPLARTATQFGTQAIKAASAPLRAYNDLMGAYEDMANKAGETLNDPAVKELLQAPENWFAPLKAPPVKLLQGGEEKGFFDSLLDFFIPSAGAAELPPEMQEAGELAAAGWTDSFVKGLEDQRAAILTAAMGVFDPSAEGTAMPESLMMHNLLEQIRTAMQVEIENSQSLATAVQTMLDASAETADTSAFATVGRDIVSGIAAGVSANSGILAGAMRNLISSALRAAKEAAVIESPSQLFADEVGAYLPAGTAMGVDNNAWMLRRSIDNMIDRSIPDVSKIASSLVQRPLHIDAMMTSAAAGNTNNYQTNNFNVPVQTPAEFANTMFLYATYGLTEA